MKKLYSAENRLLVFHIKNLLDAERIHTQIKNEFANGGVGDIAPLDTWIELWVDDDEFEVAGKKLKYIINGLEKTGNKQVICSACNEVSDAHFKMCWHCGALL